MFGRLKLQRVNLHFIHRRKTSQSNTKIGSRSDSEDVKNTATFGKKLKRGLFANRDVPINLNFPNKKGIEGYDPEFPLSQILQEFPAFAVEQAKLLKKEIMETSLTIEKKEVYEDLGLLRNNEARVEWKFDTPKALSLWHTGCDSDWNEGFSTVQFVPTDINTALFKGKICTEVVKDGRVDRAGWAAVKLEDYKAFNRKKFLGRWRNFSHLLIKCRGDGRSYKVMLYAPKSIDLSWGDSFSYPLHTRGGPYWQYEKIPFSKFFHTVAGRIQDKQYAVTLGDVSSVGIVLMDRIDGEFQLELDYIGVYNDSTHFEKFAYETYTLPLFNTHGF